MNTILRPPLSRVSTCAGLLAAVLLVFTSGALAQPGSPAPSPTAKSTKGSGTDKVPIGGGLKQMMGTEASGKGGPLYIKSDSLELNSKDRIFTYRGNVEMVRDDVTITAHSVEGRYDTENRLETVLCVGNVVITKGESMKATSDRGLYKVAVGVVELTEGPELYREGNVLAADKITVFLNEDRSEAEGNVRVKVIKSNDATTPQ